MKAFLKLFAKRWVYCQVQSFFPHFHPFQENQASFDWDSPVLSLYHLNIIILIIHHCAR